MPAGEVPSVEYRIESKVMEYLGEVMAAENQPEGGMFHQSEREETEDGEWIGIQAIKEENEPHSSAFWRYLVSCRYHTDKNDSSDGLEAERKFGDMERWVRVIQKESLTEMGSIGCAGTERSVESEREDNEIQTIREHRFIAFVGEFDPDASTADIIEPAECS